MNTSQEWQKFSKALKRLFKDALRLAAKSTEGLTTGHEKHVARFHKRLQDIIQGVCHDKDCIRLVKRLKRHESELLTFLHHRDVAPDNNHAERQIRGPVNSRKISYGNRSERGSQAQAILMSIFRTYHLRGINPFMALKSSVETWISTGSVAPLASAACLSS